MDFEMYSSPQTPINVTEIQVTVSNMDLVGSAIMSARGT